MEVPEFGGTPEKIDVTTLSDSIKKFVNGVVDMGDLAFKFLYDNSSTTANYRVLSTIEAMVAKQNWDALCGKLDAVKDPFLSSIKTKIEEVKTAMSQKDGYDYAMLAATFAGAAGSIAGAKGDKAEDVLGNIKSITKLGDLFKNIGTGWMGKKIKRKMWPRKIPKPPVETAWALPVPLVLWVPEVARW